MDKPLLCPTSLLHSQGAKETAFIEWWVAWVQQTLCPLPLHNHHFTHSFISCCCEWCPKTIFHTTGQSLFLLFSALFYSYSTRQSTNKSQVSQKIMSIIETPPSPTQSTTTTATRKTTRVVVRKPNLDDKNNAIKAIDAKIDEIRPRLV